MSNTLGYYNPVFYAQEALIQLENALGMAGRVHLGYDEERKSFEKGEYINIKKPSTFTAANAPAVAADITTESVQIQLAYWREVKFALTDKELGFTGERIINDHIRPAAYALANDVDTKLAALYKDIPWYYDLASTTAVADITGPRKIMRDNSVPLNQGMLHYMCDSTLEKGLLDLAAFTQHSGAGVEGVAAQRTGYLGDKYGFEFFANQNVQDHTSGTMADPAGAVLAGGWDKGDVSVTIDDLTDEQTVTAGDTFSIAGHTQRYAITSAATVASNAITVGISPPLKADAAADAVVTIRIDTHSANLAFHENAFALVTAPLSELGNELGAKIATVTDPITGLSLRSRIYYVGNSSAVHVALDILYGVKTLDPNLAVRCCGA